MSAEKPASMGETLINNVAQKAIARLDACMETPRERFLREHQIDVMDSLRNHFASGETAGYISLPTGSGKTALIVELAQALGMRTIVVSPTQQILEQTSKAFKKFSPYVDVSNYYSRSKDLGGEVINTTYQSLFDLTERSLINPNETELLICDEAHTALGEKRHIVFRKFPNALKIGLTATPSFTPLEGYQQRGIVDSKEPWTKLFTENIHVMSLEEAMERGILTPLDAHLIETNITVGDVHITGKGEYKTSEIQRYLVRQARDHLTIGMIAGLDKISPTVKLTAEQRQEIRVLHEKIKGKRIVVFGISIEHIEELKGKLFGLGIMAETVHGKREPKDREDILQFHKTGEIPVVLGVDILRLGWDSPETEVGIYLAPTQSGIVAVQELGRILRLSEETGKERAIAVQLVDRFEKRDRAPILIPNIFDPHYVLRGSRLGLEEKKYEQKTKKEKPIITFSGMNIEAIVQEAHSQELLRQRFKNITIQEMAEVIDSMAREIQQESHEVSVLNFYRRLAERLLQRIPTEAQSVASQAIASLDSNINAIGKRVFILLNIRRILSAAEPYFTHDQYENEDSIQAGIEYYLENFGRRNYRGQAALELYQLVKTGIAKTIAQREHMPLTWVLSGAYRIIKERVDSEFKNNPKGVTAGRAADDLFEQTRIGWESIKRYIEYRNSLIQSAEIEMSLVERMFLNKSLRKALDNLDEREKEVVVRRFGFKGHKQHSLKEVGKAMGYSGERIRQIESEALRKLRLVPRGYEMREYLD